MVHEQLKTCLHAIIYAWRQVRLKLLWHLTKLTKDFWQITCKRDMRVDMAGQK